MAQIFNNESGLSVRNKLNATGIRKNNFVALAPPTPGDDTADGYEPGSQWLDLNAGQLWVAVSVAAGSAVWAPAGAGATVTIADTPPALPENGDLWFESDTFRLHIWYDDGTNAHWVTLNAPAGLSLTIETVPVAAAGQTAFTLGAVPSDALSLVANVNGVNYYQPDFTVAGAAVNWAGPINLETSDRLVFTYI